MIAGCARGGNLDHVVAGAFRRAKPAEAGAPGCGRSVVDVKYPGWRSPERAFAPPSLRRRVRPRLDATDLRTDRVPPPRLRRRSSPSSSSSSASSHLSPSPVKIFSPLSSKELCEALTTTPAQPCRCRVRNATAGVGRTPTSITSHAHRDHARRDGLLKHRTRNPCVASDDDRSARLTEFRRHGAT